MTDWFGVLEGFYGSPFAAEDRLALVRWLAAEGGRDYVYSPKGDPFLRDRWRTPFPDTSMLTELLAGCRDVGIRLSVVVSPGLDWRGDTDTAVLVEKLQSLASLGISSLGIAFDDVPRGGASLGAAHGRAVAAAAAALPDCTISTCPVDYAVSVPTSYLRAFEAELPPAVPLIWTGPSIVSPSVSVDDVLPFDRPLVLADNVPVNDGAMGGVLHLGPYPARDPRLPEQVAGLLCNVMPLPLASRVGVACGLRWWRDPDGDREKQWEAVIADVPGLLPLARSCRSWLTDPGPDASVAAWAASRDPALEDFLAAGCRSDLPAAWQRELEPWLAAWELHAFALSYLVGLGDDPVEGAFGVAEARRRIRAVEQQLWGIRDAVYPVTRQDGDAILPDRAGEVQGHDLVGQLCDALLDRYYGGTA
ncbi:MAG: beta-N-acetylglucosaminidase domain-containing protein [Mycobacteriales bacterium]